MRKLLCVVLTMAMTLFSSQAVFAAQASAADARFSTVKEVNLSYSLAETQTFTLTSGNTVAWDNLPSRYKFLMLDISKGQKADAANRVVRTVYEREELNKASYEIALPKLEDGEYCFTFYASHDHVDNSRFAAPFGMYPMYISVSGGKCRFSEPILAPGSSIAKKLENTASAYLKDKKYVGLAIGIVKDGKTLFLNYGKSEAGGAKITEHSLFGIGSITKTFAGTILADLANQKKIDLNAPIKNYTGFSLARNNTEAKIVDLATHYSGMPRDVSSQVKEKMDEVSGQTDDMLLAYLKGVELANTPGSAYSYSNLGYAALNFIMEQETGNTFEASVKKDILDKLGMKETAVNLTASQKARLAPPHTAIGKARNLRGWSNAWTAVGGLNSSTYDMTRYIMANLGQLARGDARLSAAIALSQTKCAKNGEHDRALAWEYGDSVNGNGMYSDSFVLQHGGTDIGYDAMVLMSHQAGAGVVVLMNDYLRASGDESGVDRYALAFSLLQQLNY